ncbi:MAG: ABC transporter substrate-binding protein [Reyranellaceae bacterium]
MSRTLGRRSLVSVLSIALTGSAAGHAQQSMRRVGILTNLDQDDPETRRRLGAFEQGLREQGWVIDRNMRFEYRWGVGDAESHRRNAADMAASRPDVILAHGSTIMGPLQRATRTIPIVFVSVADPIAGGFASSLARPGGNATGFMSFDYGQSGKWMELLRDLVPGLSRVAVIRDPEQVSGGGQLGALQAVASVLRIQFVPIGVRDMNEIERILTDFAARPNGGLIVTTAAWAQIHRHELVALATRLRIPAVYPYRLFVAIGGLCCFAPNIVEQYRQAASYVDRILRGANPADLPIQAPAKYEVVVNLKAAAALGIAMSPNLLMRIDETIE